jgi:L-asparaginase
MQKLLVITLGGTIALEVNNGRAEPVASSKLLDRLPAKFGTEIELDVENFLAKDSIDLSFVDLANLAKFIEGVNDQYYGFVILTGTDTMEEVSYFLHEVFGRKLNIVITGAMRPPYSPDSDGEGNFQFALSTCAATVPKRFGVVVAMSGCLISAINVAKKSAVNLDAFVPIYMNENYSTDNDEETNTDLTQQILLSNEAYFETVNIPIISVSLGTSIYPEILEDVQGCILSCPGGYSISEHLAQAMAEIAKKKPIILTSRCLHSGTLPDDIYPGYMKSLERRGFIIEGYTHLSAHQARIKLMFKQFKTKKLGLND